MNTYQRFNDFGPAMSSRCHPVLAIASIVTFVSIVYPAPGLAQVYKSVGPDGSVTYSDGPSTPNQAPETLTTLPTYIAPKSTTSPTSPQSKTEKKTPLQYQSIRITNPSNEATIRDNTGAITVQVDVQPPLNIDAGDTLVIHVDGQPTGNPTASTTTTLTALERGSHQISAAVHNKNGTTLLQSDPVLIHLHRQSIANPR